jgi:hypothetical protein
MTTLVNSESLRLCSSPGCLKPIERPRSGLCESCYREKIRSMKGPCSMPGCPHRAHGGRGLCWSHARYSSNVPCSFVECAGHAAFKSGLCPGHESQRRHGTPLRQFQSLSGSSAAEVYLRHALVVLFDSEEGDRKIPGWRGRFDFLTNHPVVGLLAIELDGSYWHSSVVANKNGKRKATAAENAGARLIRLRQSPLPCPRQDDVSVDNKAAGDITLARAAASTLGHFFLANHWSIERLKPWLDSVDRGELPGAVSAEKELVHERICSQEACEQKTHSLGLCSRHYQYLRYHNLGECSVKDCGRSARARGLCRKHWRESRLSELAPCRIEGCPDKVASVGLCSKHYQPGIRLERIRRNKETGRVWTTGHGRVALYAQGCRCDQCRAASSEAGRQYRIQQRLRLEVREPSSSTYRV